MDLALATGRGEPLLASWDGSALVQDRHVCQIGERDELEPDYYRDIEATRIRRFPVRMVTSVGISSVVKAALAPVDGESLPLWVHVDVDVLDQAVMPAVDSPGSPGLTFEALADLLAQLLKSGRVRGLDVAIYDPDLDPTRRYAKGIVECLRQAFAAH
jgi:arginase